MPEPLELSVVDDPRNAPQTFASEADRARLTPAPLIALRNLALLEAHRSGGGRLDWDLRDDLGSHQGECMEADPLAGSDDAGLRNDRSLQRSPPPVRR